MTLQALALLLVPLGPLTLAGAVAWSRSRGLALRLVPWAAVPGLLAAILVPLGTRAEVPWMVLGTELGLDPVGRVFLAFTALLWLLAGMYGSTYLERDDRRAGFFGAWLLAMAGNLGLVVARDGISFYLFFALMSFASYPLVIHDRSAPSLRAGRVYLALVVLGELLLFAGILLAARFAGSLELAELARGLARSPGRELAAVLLLLGFGIKAGIVPLHVWLPLAHPAAPTPASAVLSGAMIKAGLLGWLRFLPPGEAAYPDLGASLATAGLFTAFYGVAVGLCQRNPKALLAYSSVSQMGLMALAFGVGLAEPAAAPATLVAITGYAFHHGLAKGALFLGVGVKPSRRGGARWLALAGWALPALALAGAPFTSGAWAKVALKAAVAQGPGAWLPWLGGCLPLTAVGTTALMVRFLILVWPGPAKEEADPSPGLWAPWLALVAAATVVPWVWQQARVFSVQALAPAYVWGSLWPILLGAAISAAAVRLGWTPPRGVPPANALALTAPVVRVFRKGWDRLSGCAADLQERSHATV
ncbi:MAG: NADH dehydrogenase, partial [Proteobacteria bacterium]|nr:NADH dehydrogenase [Pseudomonadota bacterium]